MSEHIIAERTHADIKAINWDRVHAPVEKPLNARGLIGFFVLAFLFIGLMVVGSAVVS